MKGPCETDEGHESRDVIPHDDAALLFNPGDRLSLAVARRNHGHDFQEKFGSSNDAREPAAKNHRRVRR